MVDREEAAVTGAKRPPGVRRLKNTNDRLRKELAEAKAFIAEQNTEIGRLTAQIKKLEMFRELIAKQDAHILVLNVKILKLEAGTKEMEVT